MNCDFFFLPFVAIPCESLCYAHQIETFRSVTRHFWGDSKIRVSGPPRRTARERSDREGEDLGGESPLPGR